MYACGPTVYDYGHIGNFRTFLQIDILRRFSAADRDAGAPRDEHYRCGRQDHPQRRRGGHSHRRVHAALCRGVLRGSGGAAHRAAGADCARHRTHSADGGAGGEAGGGGSGVQDRGRLVVLPAGGVSRVRQAEQERFERHGRRRARGRGRVREGLGARLCAVEGGQARRNLVGDGDRARAGRAGTSSARPWRWSTWARASTCTAAAKT